MTARGGTDKVVLKSMVKAAVTREIDLLPLNESSKVRYLTQQDD